MRSTPENEGFSTEDATDTAAAVDNHLKFLSIHRTNNLPSNHQFSELDTEETIAQLDRRLRLMSHLPPHAYIDNDTRRDESPGAINQTQVRQVLCTEYIVEAVKTAEPKSSYEPPYWKVTMRPVLPGVADGKPVVMSVLYTSTNGVPREGEPIIFREALDPFSLLPTHPLLTQVGRPKPHKQEITGGIF